MNYYIASDHAGLEVKEFVCSFLVARGFKVHDLGTNSKDSVDYPDYAKMVSLKVLEDRDSKGVLICGSGIGMSLTANKFDGVRAALCHNSYSAKMSVEHNNANILCLGARVNGLGMIEDILTSWCDSSFEGGRHQIRVEKINNRVD